MFSSFPDNIGCKEFYCLQVLDINIINNIIIFANTPKYAEEIGKDNPKVKYKSSS